MHISQLLPRFSVVLILVFSTLTLVTAQTKNRPQNPKQDKEVAKAGLVRKTGISGKTYQKGPATQSENSATAVLQSPIKFELTSIRFMADDERAKYAGDNLDPDMIVKYRLSNVSSQTIYYYVHFLDSKLPAGNSVKKTANGVVWLVKGSESSISPGRQIYSHAKWIPFAAGSTMELEALEISGAKTERFARTIFIKTSEKGPVTEFFSDFYTVPARDSAAAENKTRSEIQPIKFEITSIKFMTDEERAKYAGDNLDPDLLVKCRFSNSGNQVIYYYVDFIETKEPIGNLVKAGETGIVWLVDSTMKESSTSPGLRVFSHGRWIPFSPGSSMEWPTLDMSGPKAARFAKTIFIKTSEKGPVTEFFSDFYTVPARNSNIVKPLP